MRFRVVVPFDSFPSDGQEVSKPGHVTLIHRKLSYACGCLYFYFRSFFMESANVYRSFILIELICNTITMTISIFFIDLVQNAQSIFMIEH